MVSPGWGVALADKLWENAFSTQKVYLGASFISYLSQTTPVVCWVQTESSNAGLGLSSRSWRCGESSP